MAIDIEDLHSSVDEPAAPAAEDNNAGEQIDPDNPRNSTSEKNINEEAVGDITVAEGDDTIPAEEDNKPNGLEQFLAQYGVEGGMITFEAEDGGAPETVHISELSDDEQANVLLDLAKTKSASTEEEYGLDEEEIGLLNQIRNSGKSPREALDDMANARVEELQAFLSSESTDYDSMTDDAIFTKWIKESNPEATEEEISDELSKSKESKFFKAHANKIRDDFKESQESQNLKIKAREEAEFGNEIERQREEVVEAVLSIEDIAGFKPTDDQKNEVLSEVLELNEHGDSKFMAEVFADPQKLFKAAFLYYKGEEQIDALEAYWRKQKNEAFVSGKNAALKGAPGERHNGFSAPVEDYNPSDPDSSAPRASQHLDLDDLHKD